MGSGLGEINVHKKNINSTKTILYEHTFTYITKIETNATKWNRIMDGFNSKVQKPCVKNAGDSGHCPR